MRAINIYKGALAKAKGGPGSRGGTVISRTRSGKPVYAASKNSMGGRDIANMDKEEAAEHVFSHHKKDSWTAADHDDAANAHAKHEQATQKKFSSHSHLTQERHLTTAMRASKAAEAHAEVARYLSGGRHSKRTN